MRGVTRRPREHHATLVSTQVSVIVLNYNGRSWLGPCLDALDAQAGAPPFEVVLVDNASTDGSPALVADRYPRVRLVECERNLGFAAGNNTGARVASGSLLVFLNNDTIVSRDWLSSLYRASVSRPDVGLFTSRLVFLDRPDIVDSAGDGYLRAGGAYKHGHGLPAEQFEQSGEVFGACGAAFMIRRELFERLGGFDERFFMVYEDVDLSYRARLAGHRCWYVAEAVVRHAGSGTLGTLSHAAVYYGQRNLEWTWMKNTPLLLLLRTLPAHAVYSAAGVVQYVRTGRGGAAVSGKIAALLAVPRLIGQRRRIQRARLIRPAAVEGVMQKGWLGLKRREKSVRRAG
jgi:GT2 family glycosyltransferase